MEIDPADRESVAAVPPEAGMAIHSATGHVPHLDRVDDDKAAKCE